MIVEQDEFLHLDSAPIPGALFVDTTWFSVMDPDANVFGVAQIFLTNHGYSRWASLFQIDGVLQYWGNKHFFDAQKEPRGPWGDGRMSYEVLRPLDAFRVSFNGPLYAYDLNFKARYPAFEYDHSQAAHQLTEANDYFSMVWGGHFEQAMDCHGQFEIRQGPASGQVRNIACRSHRERSWMHNFHEEKEWERVSEPRFAGHFWLILHLDDAQLCALGCPQGSRLSMPTVGSISSAQGDQPLRGVEAEIILSDDSSTAIEFRFVLNMPDGRRRQVRSLRKLGEIKLWYRGDNCLDNPVDCFEAFCEFELDDGRRCMGVCEYSIHPAQQRWLS